MMKVLINNLPRKYDRFVVVRAVEGEAWYWGSWGDMKSAQNCADELDNALVVDMEGGE